jgi:hypothetical protein
MVVLTTVMVPFQAQVLLEDDNDAHVHPIWGQAH